MSRRKRNPHAKALEDELYQPRVIQLNTQKILDDLAGKEAEDEIEHYLRGGNDD